MARKKQQPLTDEERCAALEAEAKALRSRIEAQKNQASVVKLVSILDLLPDPLEQAVFLRAWMRAFPEQFHALNHSFSGSNKLEALGHAFRDKTFHAKLAEHWGKLKV